MKTNSRTQTPEPKLQNHNMTQRLTVLQTYEAREEFGKEIDAKSMKAEGLLGPIRGQGYGERLSNYLKYLFNIFLANFTAEESRKLVYTVFSIQISKLKTDSLIASIFSNEPTLLIERSMCLPEDHNLFKKFGTGFKESILKMEESILKMQKYYIEQVKPYTPVPTLYKIQSPLLCINTADKHGLLWLIIDTRREQERIFKQTSVHFKQFKEIIAKIRSVNLN